MNTQVNTQPERGVKVHDVVRSAEKWWGVFFRVRDILQLEKIKSGLELILSQAGYVSPKIEDNIIYSKGEYTDEIVKRIEKYLASFNGKFESEPIMAYGSRDYFNGDRWLNKLKAKY